MTCTNDKTVDLPALIAELLRELDDQTYTEKSTALYTLRFCSSKKRSAAKMQRSFDFIPRHSLP